MTQHQIKNSIFVSCSVLIFLLDIVIFAYCRQHIFLLLHCFVIMCISYHHRANRIAIPIFLLCIISYLDYDRFGLPLMYIVPIFLLSKYLDEYVQVKTIIPYALISSSLILQCIIVQNLYQMQLSWSYMLYMHGYNTIIFILFMMLHRCIEKFVIPYKSTQE